MKGCNKRKWSIFPTFNPLPFVESCSFFCCYLQCRSLFLNSLWARRRPSLGNAALWISSNPRRSGLIERGGRAEPFNNWRHQQRKNFFCFGYSTMNWRVSLIVSLPGANRIVKSCTAISKVDIRDTGEVRHLRKVRPLRPAPLLLPIATRNWNYSLLHYDAQPSMATYTELYRVKWRKKNWSFTPNVHYLSGLDIFVLYRTL